MRNLNLILITLAFCLQLAYSQDANTGIVKIRTVPVVGELLMRSGDSLITTTQLVLPAGTHPVTLWAPGYNQFDTLLTVIPDTTIVFRKYLTRSKEYISYQEELGIYKRKIGTPWLISFWTSTTLVAASTGMYFDTKNAWQRVLDAKARYESSTFYKPLALRSAYEQEIDTYNKKKNRFYGIGVATTISVGVFAYYFLKGKRTDKPTFENPAPPFQLTYMGLPNQPSNAPQNNYWVLSTSLNF